MKISTIILLAGLVLLVVIVSAVTSVTGTRSTRCSGKSDGAPLRYRKVPLMSQYEREFYKILRERTDHYRCTVFVKVRLWDLIDTVSGDENWRAAQNKIARKHVDFVIVDEDVNVLAIVELDDNTHRRSARVTRDAFVDEALRGVGYNVFHAKSLDRTRLDDFLKKTLEK